MNKNTFSWFRIGKGKNLRFFVHNKCDEKELDNMLSGLCAADFTRDSMDDGLAHIVGIRSHTVIYRINDEVYIIPATPKALPMAIIDNNDGKKPTALLEFDYPCEMKREDLVEY